MTIRPVDLQVLIPKVTEVGKNQHVTDHQDTLQQQQFAGQWQQISAKREQQVQGKAHNEDSKVGRDNHHKEQNHGKNGQKQQEGKSSKTDADRVNHPSSEDPIRGNLIDIKT